MIAQNPSSQPLLPFYETMYCPMKLSLVAESTKRKYEIAIRHLERHLGRSPLVSDLNRETVQRFTTYWVETKGRSAVTADGYRRKLNRLTRFAVWLGLLEKAETLQPLVSTAATRNKVLPDDVRLGFVTASGKAVSP